MSKPPMKKKIPTANKPTKSHPGRGGLKVSLWPLKPDHALSLMLRVKPEDVKKQKQAEKRQKGKWRAA